MFFILFRRIPGEAGNAKKKNNNKKKIQYYCNMASIVFFLNPQSHLLTNQMEHTGENLQAPVGEHCNGQNWKKKCSVNIRSDSLSHNFQSLISEMIRRIYHFFSTSKWFMAKNFVFEVPSTLLKYYRNHIRTFKYNLLKIIAENPFNADCFELL